MSKHHHRCPKCKSDVLERMIKACEKDNVDPAEEQGIECYSCICCCDKNNKLSPEELNNWLNGQRRS